MTPVIVVWKDAVDHGDGSERPTHKPHTQICIGWLLQYDDDGVSVAYEYNEITGAWRNEVFIPDSLIESVLELELFDD